MYTRFEDKEMKVKPNWGKYICFDKIYRCKQDIDCSNGKFSSGSLVMLVDCGDINGITVADFTEISQNVMKERNANYCLEYAYKGWDTFHVEPEEFLDFFEEMPEVTLAVQEIKQKKDKWDKYFISVPIFFAITITATSVFLEITDNFVAIIVGVGIGILCTLLLCFIISSAINRKLYSMQKTLHERLIKCAYQFGN